MTASSPRIAQKGKVPPFGGEICDGAIGVDANWQLTGKLTWENHVMSFILCCRFILPTMAGDTHTHRRAGTPVNTPSASHTFSCISSLSFLRIS